MKYHKGSSIPYGSKASTGDIIGVHLNFEKNTIEFSRNGESEGVAFTNLDCAVQLAVSMTALGCQVSLLPIKSNYSPEVVEMETLDKPETAPFWDGVDASDDFVFDGPIIAKTKRPQVFTTAVSKCVLEQGITNVRFKLDALIASPSSLDGIGGVIVGIVPTDFVAKHSDDIVIGSVQGGWGMVSITGDKISSSAESDFECKTIPYGNGFAQGSVVDMTVDLESGNVSFRVDGVQLGTAFTNVTGPVRVAASITGVGTKLTVHEIGDGDVSVPGPLQLLGDEDGDGVDEKSTVNDDEVVAMVSAAHLPKTLAIPEPWFENILLAYECLQSIGDDKVRFPLEFARRFCKNYNSKNKAEDTEHLLNPSHFFEVLLQHWTLSSGRFLMFAIPYVGDGKIRFEG